MSEPSNTMHEKVMPTYLLTGSPTARERNSNVRVKAGEIAEAVPGTARTGAAYNNYVEKGNAVAGPSGARSMLGLRR
jgi:hypothetical protein